MKKIIALTLLSTMSIAVSAGEALIPYWALTGAETSCLSVSNASNTDVKVKITLYNYDGTEYSGAIEFTHNISSLSSDTILTAKNSASFCLKKYSGDRAGYGIIQTTNVDSTDAKSFVVAYGRQVQTAGGYHSASITINNGMPF